MNLGQILDIVNFITNKEQSGNTFSPVQYNTMLPVADKELYDYYLGKVEEYQIPIRQARVSFESTQRITESLRPFKKVNPCLLVGSDGVAILPSDYQQISYFGNFVYSVNGCETTVTPVSVNVLTSEQFIKMKGSMAYTPTQEYPIVDFQNTFCRFAPVNLQSVEICYYIKPITPVYDYYIDANGDNIYLPQGTTHRLLVGEEYPRTGQTYVVGVNTDITGQSVELLWNDIDQLKIVRRLLGFIGINLSDQMVENYAAMKIERGS